MKSFKVNQYTNATIFRYEEVTGGVNVLNGTGNNSALPAVLNNLSNFQNMRPDRSLLPLPEQVFGLFKDQFLRNMDFVLKQHCGLATEVEIVELRKYEKSSHYFRLTKTLKYEFLSWLFCLFSGHSHSCDRGPTGDSVWLSHANFVRTRIFTALGKMKPPTKKGNQEKWLVKTCFRTFNVFRKRPCKNMAFTRPCAMTKYQKGRFPEHFFRPKRNCDAYQCDKKIHKKSPSLKSAKIFIYWETWHVDITKTIWLK